MWPPTVACLLAFVILTVRACGRRIHRQPVQIFRINLQMWIYSRTSYTRTPSRLHFAFPFPRPTLVKRQVLFNPQIVAAWQNSKPKSFLLKVSSQKGINFFCMGLVFPLWCKCLQELYSVMWTQLQVYAFAFERQV